MRDHRPYPKPSLAPETEEGQSVIGGGGEDNGKFGGCGGRIGGIQGASAPGGDGGVPLTLEVFTRILSEGVVAMEQAALGDEVRIHGDFARVTLDIPLGVEPDGYFERAKRAYVEKCDEIRRKLGG